MVHSIGDKKPVIDKAAFIGWNAEVAGEVSLGEDSSVWFSVTMRGDLAPITVGRRTNIQDNTVVHVDTDTPTVIGDEVVVGHNAIIHGCTIGEGSLIGMGSIILNRAKIGKECIVGAGALVTEGKEFPDRSVIVGSPARAIRTLSDEQAGRIRDNVERYVKKAKQAAAEYREI